MAKPTIVTRTTKGSALTWTEGDANITNLRDATLTVKAGTGGTDVVSDLNGIITLVAGTNVTLSGDNTAKTVTINSTASGGATTLDGLTDVVITAAASGELLVYNGTNWVDTAASSITVGKSTNLVGGNGTTLLGSIPYQSATDTTSLLSPNTTVTSKFLTQVGDGTNGMAPMWQAISSLDNVTIGSITPAAASFTTTTVRTGNELRLNNTPNTYYAGFKAGTMASNVVWTLPSTDGTNGQALKTDGAGGLTFGSISASPAGSDTQVQYNNAGSFGANSALTFNIATGALSATTFIGALTGTATRATNLVGGNGTTLLGSIPYQSATNTTTLLSPNTTTTNKFLAQVGDGTNGMAPMWQAITSLENVMIGSVTPNTGRFTTLTSTGRTVIKDLTETIATVTYAATITPDVANGTVQKVTLTGNVTFSAFSNPVTGQSLTLIVTQDATGSRLLTSTMKFSGASKTLSTAANSIDIITIFYDGTNYFASLGKGFA